MVYLQNLYEVQRSRLPIDRDTAADLAAIQCYSEYGLYSEANEKEILKNIQSYIP